ncbi:hypothetical protein OAO55_00700 [Bacteroidales bacterium]|nr:hypothetical protein [Bacteroidales bacterium]
MKFTTTLILMGMVVIGNAQDRELVNPDGTQEYLVIDHEKENEIHTLFGGEIDHGFYLSFDMDFSSINSKDFLGIGGRMAWIWDHNFAVGMHGKGIMNYEKNDYMDPLTKEINPDGKKVYTSLGGGYGGIFFEPILMAQKPIHVSFPVKLGVGGLSYKTDTVSDSPYWRTYYYDEDDEWDIHRDYRNDRMDTDLIFVVEPGVEIEFNVVKHFRFSLYTTYRMVEGVNLDKVKDDALTGLSYGFALKFGIF